MNEKLFDYIESCPTAFHAAAHTARLLSAAGFTELKEHCDWEIEPGKGYFTVRNGSSVIAFRVPQGDFCGMMMTAAHLDSPAFKLRENAEIKGGIYARLSTEKYGGMLCSTWMDRPLAVAGRVLVRTGEGIRSVLVDSHDPVAVIPNVAIHMNRKANEGTAFDAAVDMVPVFSAGEEDFSAFVARLAGVPGQSVLSTDLIVYEPARGREWGDYITAPRLDDLECAFACLEGFLKAERCPAMQVLCLFDNEEVGSSTKQGAGSTFLKDVLYRTVTALGRQASYTALLDSSLLLSCDNAHAVHPNHPEYADKLHQPKLNGGPVLKFNAAQRYTTDAVSAALFMLIAEKANVPVQRYVNRADLAGGSTLGNILTSQVSVDMADIGLAQLAMHSAMETAGARDVNLMVTVLRQFYETHLIKEQDGWSVN